MIRAYVRSRAASFVSSSWLLICSDAFMAAVVCAARLITAREQASVTHDRPESDSSERWMRAWVKMTVSASIDTAAQAKLVPIGENRGNTRHTARRTISGSRGLPACASIERTIACALWASATTLATNSTGPAVPTVTQYASWNSATGHPLPDWRDGTSDLRQFRDAA